MTQLLGDPNCGSRSSGSDSDFLPKMVKKGSKRGWSSDFKGNSGESSLKKSSPTPHHDSARSIDSVYVTGIISPPSIVENVTKEAEIPPSNGFLSSDEESCGVFRRTQKKGKPTVTDNYAELLLSTHNDDEGTEGKVKGTTTNPNINMPDPTERKAN